MLENPISRAYVRTDNWAISAKIGDDRDAAQWREIKVLDMAAGGMLILTDTPCVIGDEKWFDLLIDPMTPGVRGKIPMMIKGEIKGDRGSRDGLSSFSVAFTDISQSDRIRLDELIRITTQKYRVDAESNMFDR